MPLYEYQCEECGQKFEVRQKFSDPPIETCNDCGGRARKLISQTAFALKGGGWYQEGYTASKGGATATAGNEKNTTKPDKAETKSGGTVCDSCPKAVNA